MIFSNPIALKRYRRFRGHRRAWYSMLLLLVLYVLSLCAELLCNGVPLLMKYRGRYYFPFIVYYPDNLFTGSGLNTRPDYKKLACQEEFVSGNSWMLWAPLPTGPNDIVPLEELSSELRVECRLEPVQVVCGLSVDVNSVLTRFQGAELIEHEAVRAWKGAKLQDFWELQPELQAALRLRFHNLPAPDFEAECKGKNGLQDAVISLAEYNPRNRAPKQVRLTLRSIVRGRQSYRWIFSKHEQQPLHASEAFMELQQGDRDKLLAAVEMCGETRESVTGEMKVGGMPYGWSMEPERVRFPFRPVKGHLLGLDNAGRDVLARLLYALRTSLNFGLILVCCSMLVGSCLGLLQGYMGGWIDLAGQRLVEIWSALPFLYVIILMGSIYGPGFWLMIFCYALFNWIGISHYMRGEMLRLRKQQFVEAAKCLGLPGWRIVMRHILPNALIPIITFFPFSLVGAIGSLAALDYLGFGLPPPTPSIGQLLQQAQSQRWAWWLILYPALTLFLVMLLGVFVGEGVREAFDPRKQGRLE